MNNLLNFLINSQTNFINFIRFAIFIVMVWIGGLKAYQYEADGIVPFVTNSPFMNFFYTNANKIVINNAGENVKEYVLHKNQKAKLSKKI